jgi:hypothetical protein
MPPTFSNDLFWRHLSEQYLTSFQQLAHFFRQLKGRLHTGHIFVGKLDLDLVFPIAQHLS